MKKLFWIIPLLGLVILAFSTKGLSAKPNSTSRVNSPKGRAAVVIPERAIEVAPGVFHLGTALDNGQTVEGYAFVKYKKGFEKPGTVCGNGICEPGENKNKCPEDCGGDEEEPDDNSTCYDFLARDAKWKTVENYIVNPANTRELDEEFIASNFATDIDKWETEAGIDILGIGSSTNEILVADTVSPDNKNEAYFADVDHEGAIAITIVWGIFGGPPPFRQLVEWDQVYDDVDFDWSENGEADKMDFESIATHELGHSVGLGDLYTDACSEQTMYGYAGCGETKKRSLEAGDIAGIKKLYR